MAFRLLAQPMRKAIVPTASRTASSVASVTPAKGPDGMPTEHHIYKDKIGTREIVGFGWNGLPTYADRHDFPIPAIRWKEETPDISVSLIPYRIPTN